MAGFFEKSTPQPDMTRFMFRVRHEMRRHAKTHVHWTRLADECKAYGLPDSELREKAAVELSLAKICRTETKIQTLKAYVENRTSTAPDYPGQ